ACFRFGSTSTKFKHYYYIYNLSKKASIYPRVYDSRLGIFPNPNQESLFVESSFSVYEISLFGMKVELLLKGKFKGNLV
ncbi:MAG: hypothetical protein JXR58_08375, partial [Bacteroidales bacterium]|nr:hypothetical protein [Bacteroidales bacterium]